MTVLKKFIIFILALVIFCFVVPFCIPFFVNLDKHKDNIFDNIEKQTNLKLTCEKTELIKGISPYLKLHLYHCGVMYPNNEKFAQIKEANIKIKTFPLLFKKIEIEKIEVERPIINITLYKDFSTSLEKYIKNQTDLKGFIISKIPIVNCKNYKVNFKDESINKNFYFEGNELKLTDIKLNDSAQILLSGKIYSGQKDYIKYNLDVTTSLKKEDFIDYKKTPSPHEGGEIKTVNSQKKPSKSGHFTFSPFKTMYEYGINGEINGKLKRDKNNSIFGTLEIQNLSLNTGNIISQNNNADLEFKGSGVKINALVHTSKNDSALIEGKFDFGKKKFVDIDTKAKNVNIENLIKIFDSVSKILNVKSILNDVCVKGILNADFNIKSDFKKLNSKGKAQIINGSLIHKSVKYPVSKINADINFDNNQINIIKAQANINETPITLSGSIKQDLSANLKVYSQTLKLKDLENTFDINLPFSVLSGNIDFSSEINGKLPKNIKLNTDIKVKNLSLSDKKTKIPFKSQNCKITFEADKKSYKGKLQLENSSVRYNKFDVKIPLINIDFDDKKIVIQKNDIKILNSTIQTEGTIHNYTKNPKGKINFKGDMQSKDAAAFISSYIKQPYKAEGKLNTSGNIAIENNKIKFNTKIKADKNNYVSYLVIKELLNRPTITNIDIEKEQNVIKINNVSILDNAGAKINVTGGIEGNKLNNVKLIIPNNITLYSDFLGGEKTSLKADLLLNNSIDKPEMSGNIRISKFDLEKYQTLLENADISLNNDKIKVSAPNVKINNSKLNLDVEMGLKNLTISNMQISSQYIDLNELLKYEKDLLNKTSIKVEKGKAIIRNVILGDLKAQDTQSEFNIENGNIKITNMSSKAYGGTVKGSANYELKTGIADIYIEGKNLNIKSSMKDLCAFDDNISGQTDVKMKVSMLTGSKNTIIKTLSGQMEFNAQNGTMGTLGKFEYYLDAKNLMYHGLLNTTLNRLIHSVSHDDTTHYRKANGKVIFKKGYIITDSVKVQGEKMSLYIDGKHNMNSNLSNLVIYGRISDEISAKLGNFADVSISDIVGGAENKKANIVQKVSQTNINEIPRLYLGGKSNTFKADVSGNIKALNAINSFTWIIPSDTINEEQTEESEEKLPGFMEL